MSFTLNGVYTKTYKARNKWRNILLALKVDHATIDSIGAKWRDNPDNCYREGLDVWLRGEEKSWKDVVEALSSRTVGHSGIARALEESYVHQEEKRGGTGDQTTASNVVQRDSPHDSSTPVSSSTSEESGMDVGQTTPNPVLTATEAVEESGGQAKVIAALATADGDQLYCQIPKQQFQPVSTVSATDATQSSHDESGNENQDEPLASARPRRPSSAFDKQVNSDIEGVVTRISPLISDVNTERLQLVAESILDEILDGKNALEIYLKISNKYESRGQASFAATLFREALIYATNTNEVKTRFSHLNDLCDPECLTKQIALLEMLKSRQSLLEFGDNELGGMQLNAFVEEFKDTELGTSRDNITTPTKLFKCLLRKNVLPSQSPSEWITILKTRLSNAKTETSHTETSPTQGLGIEEHYAGDGAGAKVMNPPKCEDVDSTSQDKLLSDEEGETVKEQLLSKTWKIGLAVIGVLLAAIFVSLLAFSSTSGLSSQGSHFENTSLCRNTTILVSKRLNTQYYERIMFTLKHDIAEFPNITTCVFDCTYSEPQLFTAFGTHNLTSTHSAVFDPLPTRRYAHIRESHNVPELIYMLEGSTLLFSLNNDIPVPLQLHILTSAEQCRDFYAGKINLSARNFSLNEANNYTANFTVLPGEPPSYYCGVWVIDSNVTFNFAVKASVVAYNVNFYQQRGFCQPISTPSCTLTFPLSILERYTCVLLSQLNPSATVYSAKVDVQTTFPNPIFSLFISLCAVVFTIIIVLGLSCVVWKVCKRNLPTRQSCRFK